MTSPGPGGPSYPENPPWPPPGDLAEDAVLPPMDSRDRFITDAVNRFGDDGEYAKRRWDAARRLLIDGDFSASISMDPDPVPRILASWLLTPREEFLPLELRHAAYLPNALPVGHGQTISAPYMVTRMTAAINPAPGDRVLEIGTGTGYQAAMLAPLSTEIRTVETVPALASEARRTMERLGTRRVWLERIRIRLGNGYEGWDEGAPYDRIIVTCAIDHVPRALTEQLTQGGILVLPLGPPRVQVLTAVRRRAESEVAPPDPGWTAADGLDGGDFDVTDVYGDGTRVVFVPFVH